MRKDVIEGFLGGDLSTGDFGEDGEGLAEVFAQQVGGEGGVEAFNDTLETGLGSLESLVVAGIGDDDVGIGESGDIGGCIDGLLQGGKALSCLGTDGEDCGEG